MSTTVESAGGAPQPLPCYEHQVAGRLPMLRLSADKICKPAVDAEIAVYEALASRESPVTQFTPRWYGFITIPIRELAVSFRQGGVGGGCAGGSRPAREDSESSAASGAALPVGPESVAESGSDGSLAFPQMPRVPSGGTVGTAGSAEGSEPVSPWADSVFSNYRHKRLQVSGDGNCRFIVLEDVSARFRCPCILDIKMGTRQHGYNAPPRKVRSKTTRCLETTSASLGLRVCGLQAYQTTTGQYVRKDKYWGRSLTKDTIGNAFSLFLHNGERVRSEVARAMVPRLEQLAESIRETNWRYWSSSILLVFEGDDLRRAPSTTSHSASHGRDSIERAPEATELVATAEDFDVRLIDFAHLYRSSDLAGPDEGMLMGIKNIVSLLAACS